MRYNNSFIKTNKGAKKFESVNATLLQKAGFIDQTMAGVYTFLPLGWKVLNNIENIIRKEMDKLGVELLMSAFSPRSLWEQTKRSDIDILFEAQGANDASRRKNKTRPILNPTHEDVITPIALKIKPSYKDLPYAVYQIQTKFRNEERPKSGLLRGREFRMKDLYSFHASEKDLLVFYEKVKAAYATIFQQLGLGEDTIVANASGGDFTSGFSHEFNAKLETGEDTVYYDSTKHVYYNAEVAPTEVMAQNKPIKVSEVGNIFPLGTKFSEAFGYYYTDKRGHEKPVYMASYGIGSSRVMGVIAEKYHDENGLCWPAQVAPHHVYLIGINLENMEIKKLAESLYERLRSTGINVLLDDRQGASPGDKLSDADLIGCPWRFVVSTKTGNKVEVKQRTSGEPALMSVDDALKHIA